MNPTTPRPRREFLRAVSRTLALLALVPGRPAAAIPSQGVPLYCGEFGVFPVHAEAGHRAQWFRDVGQILAERQIGWAVWG